MFKLSWSYITAIFFLSFVVFILGLIYLAVHERFELVAPDYYAQELKFQQRIDAAANTDKLTEPTRINIRDKDVEIILPTYFKGKAVTGNVYFFRPSDERKDVTFSLKPDVNGVQLLSSSK